MARQKAFDPDGIVDKAQAVFRQRGYAATSVDDLVHHLGIGRGSMYDTFGSKHALYLAALDRYLAQNAGAPQAVPMADAKATIAAILDEQVKEAIAAAPKGGCFLVNAIVELSGRDPEVAQRVAANLKTAERMFETLLAQDTRLDLAADEQRRLAQFFVNITLSIRLQAKANPDRAMLDNVVATALRVLA